MNVFPDYRRKNAQRMYTSRGYIMDGNGLQYRNVPVEPGSPVMVDDDQLLYPVKELEGQTISDMGQSVRPRVSNENISYADHCIL